MKSLDVRYLENLSVGLEVEIKNKRSNKIKNGVIVDILTKSNFHPYGIMVKLHNGDIGRVIKISKEYNDDKLDINDNVIDINNLIMIGENNIVEYKSSALWSKNITDEEIKSRNSKYLTKYGRKCSKIIIAKVISAFSNTNGGNIIIGIKENKNTADNEIIGIESDFSKLANPCIDGYRRMIIDEIIKPFFNSDLINHLNDNVKINFPKVENHTLCWLEIYRSKTPVFIKISGKDNLFIRVDAEIKELHDSELVEYCSKHFKD